MFWARVRKRAPSWGTLAPSWGVPSISGSTMSEIGNRVFQNYYTKPNEEK